MTTFATSPTTSIETDSEEREEEHIGYQLCEFCSVHGEPSNPESVCECSEITRHRAGSVPVDYADKYDTILRLAEHALLEQWSYGHTDIRILESTIGGQCSEEYTVAIHFEGMLAADLTEPLQLDAGTARVWSFSGDGKLRVGVTLTDD